MSYVGDFTLSADIGDQNTFELVDKAVAAMNSYMDFDSYEDCHAVWRDINDTWRAHEEDLLALSKKFPQILFVLECQGEIASDLWRQFFQDGKMQFCPAYSTFWPYISNRMKEPSADHSKSSEESEEELELSSDQIARLDVMDNAVYQCLLALLGKDEEDFPWSMDYIGEAEDLLVDFLLKRGHRIRRPAIVTEPDGTQYIEEYEEPEVRKFENITNMRTSSRICRQNWEIDGKVCCHAGESYVIAECGGEDAGYCDVIDADGRIVVQGIVSEVDEFFFEEATT